MGYLFEINDLKFKSILDIKQLNIKKNVVTTIVGSSGSGKTTLLKMLNKLISPDSGTILYNSNDLSLLDSVLHRREVIMLSQNPAIFDGTIKDNLLKVIEFHEKNVPNDDLLKAILKQVRLEKELDTNSSKLSGGEKQRLALARVIVLEPKVLLLDEPSSALDSQTEDEIITMIVEYAKHNEKTLIMITHSKNVAQKFSDEVIELKKQDNI